MENNPEIRVEEIRQMIKSTYRIARLAVSL